MNLNGNWKLYFAPSGKVKCDDVTALSSLPLECIKATVPGNVELDLIEAGLLPRDIFRGTNILQAQKYETYEWWYETAFTPDEKPAEDEKAILHFGAVDCIAEYYLNGEKIYESENMFISHDIDVTDKLLYGKENTLVVHIASSILTAAAGDVEPCSTLYEWQPTNICTNIRKAAHSFGWDIMPRAVSAGIWRDVELKIEKKYGFRYLYFAISGTQGDTTNVRIAFDTTLPDEYTFAPLLYKIYGSCGESTFENKIRHIAGSGKIGFSVKNAKFWWPKPYGEPNLYDITVECWTPDGETMLFSKKVRRGLRTLELRHSDVVEPGGGFDFIVNGKRIMVTGTNWVPMDPYHSRDKGRYAKAFELLDDVGVNMVRCWGGNVYEQQEFYDFCDEHGILVWQDFAMACHFYPQTEEFQAKLRAEAEWVVKEFRDHPSLAVWAGDNEIDSMLAGQGRAPSVNYLTREVLPRVIERLDPCRPYIASSPYISDRAFYMGQNDQGSPFYPEDHLWGPRDYFKSDFYKGSGAYFVSETGYHGCPSRDALEKMYDPEYLWPYQNNEQWNFHSTDQSNRDGRCMVMHKQIQQLFGEVPTDIDGFVFASQVVQAEAKKFFIENFRGNMKEKGGLIWWNLLDGWPQTSDSVVDYYYNKKLAFDYIKRSQQPFIIMVKEMSSWGQDVICANSTLEPVSGKVKITDAETGKVMFESNFSCDANGNANIGRISLMYSDKGMMLIEWETDKGEKGFNTYLYGSPAFDLEKYKEWFKKIK